MGLHYSHIDLAERQQIQDRVVASVPVAAIARRLGRHRSTVHREIGRNFHHTSFRDGFVSIPDKSTIAVACRALSSSAAAE